MAIFLLAATFASLRQVPHYHHDGVQCRLTAPLGVIFGGRSACRWATNMSSGGSKRNNKDSPGQRLGVKKFSSEHVQVSDILIKQRGTKYKPGDNVARANDDSLYALVNGTVKFTKDKATRKTQIHVIPYLPLHSERELGPLKAIKMPK